MEWTLGTITFYGGIAGIVVSIIAALIVIIALGSANKKITKKLNDEYGEVSK
jgi:tetrahydromethanopterin S-methyltransferase subunit E